jgi:hypothetical protein
MATDNTLLRGIDVVVFSITFAKSYHKSINQCNKKVQ